MYACDKYKSNTVIVEGGTGTGKTTAVSEYAL